MRVVQVYRGRLRGEPVAIKMIWSVDITADIVARFREEVLMLARLSRHPNIVQVPFLSLSHMSCLSYQPPPPPSQPKPLHSFTHSLYLDPNIKI